MPHIPPGMWVISAIKSPCAVELKSAAVLLHFPWDGRRDEWRRLTESFIAAQSHRFSSSARIAGCVVYTQVNLIVLVIDQV